MFSLPSQIPVRRIVAAGGLALATAFMTTACSSTSSSTSSPGSAASSAAAKLHGTYKLMVIAPLTSQGGAGVPVAPEIPVGAEAAAAQINDGGGVNGKSITIVPCDTGGTANGPVECARLAVQDHVIAVVGSTDDGSELPELQAAGIPDVADIPAGAEYTSPDSFPIMGEAPVLLAGMVSVPAKTGAKSVSIVTSSGAAVAGVSALLKLVEARYPAVTVKVIPIPSTAVDLSAVVAQAEQSQVIGLSPNNLDSLAAFITAYNQSANKKPLISNDFTISSAAITQLGQSLDSATILSNFLPSTDTSDSDVATYDKWMSDINPGVNKDSESANAYDGVLLFAQLARQIKNVSAAWLIEALDHEGTIQLPMLPTFNMSKPAAGVGPFTRISNADLTVSTVKNGTITTSGGQFINPYVP